MARVNVERAAFGDARYVLLGQDLGITKWDALARCAAVWDYCQERGRKTLPARMIDALHNDLPDFSGAMIRAELARKDGNEVYIAGSNGRTEWLKNLRDSAPKGGAARQAALTDEERSELGRRGAAARWGKKMPEPEILAEYQPSGSHDASAPAPAPAPARSPKKEKVGSKAASSSRAGARATDDDAAEEHVEMLTTVVKQLCPQMKSLQRRNVLDWLSDYRDKGPWWVAAALIEGNGTMAKARSPAYLAETLRNRLAEAFEFPEAEQYVRHQLRTGGVTVEARQEHQRRKDSS